MNGFVNADTYNAAVEIQNIQSLYIAARRMNNGFQLRNLYADAQMAGMARNDIEIEEVDFDEILDSVLDD